MTKVSILIAARNEEKNIVSCLQAIEQLHWPTEDLEVWVGDDRSEDRTVELIRKHIGDKPFFHLLCIGSNVGQTSGKANVLAQLAHQATSDFFFITDADVQVPPDWISAMLAGWKPGVGIVNGVTLTRGRTFLAHMQAIEWVYALRVMKQLADLNLPVTAMGNNMMTTREAYLATGGYENLPFSLTEDYQLFRQIIDRGYGFRQAFAPGVLAFTEPVNSLSGLLQQRKRWMTGALQLPWFLKIFLFAEVLFMPLLLILWFHQPFWAWLLLGVRLGFMTVTIYQALRQLGQLHLFGYTGLYLPYHFLIVLANFIYYLLPVRIQWKGRRY